MDFLLSLNSTKIKVLLINLIHINNKRVQSIFNQLTQFLLTFHLLNKSMNKSLFQVIHEISIAIHPVIPPNQLPSIKVQNHREFLYLIILLNLLIMLLVNKGKSQPASRKLLLLGQIKHSFFDVFENELISLPY